MKLAVIGSRGITELDLEKYISNEVTRIITGGARGVDTCAARYAQARGIPLTEFHPDYRRYGRGAPLKRNLQIIENADMVLAFWDGSSRGTRFVIEICRERKIPIQVIEMNKES